MCTHIPVDTQTHVPQLRTCISAQTTVLSLKSVSHNNIKNHKTLLQELVKFNNGG
jgi:hypothetical protein